ncbi:hypothetical protein [Candidatus Methanodesulfokora washburnensis]|uniref:Uncharacterized protein n=1 Tax=Candidatus Methanodesulfokora washburnensis TaxID=2478471 RepID=A0A429GBV5_9CREN|nr:hypothetical protein [Candidatus Methanodesulfokores washburnensis]RSN71266.1 hypothetical protein D6D85_16305 [Candidatus Methanodesulfokores washburnensis]
MPILEYLRQLVERILSVISEQSIEENIGKAVCSVLYSSEMDRLNCMYGWMFIAPYVVRAVVVLLILALVLVVIEKWKRS